VTAVRKAVFAVWLYGLTVVLAILFLPALLMPRGAIMTGVALWARLAVWGLRWIAGVRIEVRGLERLPAGGVLIAAKHQSFFDILPPFFFLSDACFVLKKELTQIPVFGWHCRKAKMIPVDREAHSRALKDLVSSAVARLKEGRQLIIFPEGTRKRPGAAADYKPGVAALYRELGLACTPMATNSGEHVTSAGLLRRTGVIVFEILEPIPAGLKRGEFMRALQERIETASTALSRESGAF
jgi:1-acyl-sn-glycerol-3-phosphate acyltransferase